MSDPENPAPVEPERRRGRGAAFNPANRYERHARAEERDGWDLPEELPPLRTEVTVDHSRSILARNDSPDIPFDRSINPYRGCEHGCIYCYARPSHAQLGLSPGLDFETRLLAKPEAPRLLAEALARRGYRVAPIAFGTNTDPYQPVEREWRIMRGLLEVLLAHRHPLMITTKGALITRDLDLLGELARMELVAVALSITSLDARLSRAMEPRAASAGRLLRVIEALARAGVPVGVNVAPVIPGLTEHEIERVIAAAAAAGARWAAHTVLRLPGEVEALFRDWLAREFPERAARVLRGVAELHGGALSEARFGSRMKGFGTRAALIARRVSTARRRHRLAGGPPVLRTDLFRRPPGAQLELFD